MQAKSQACRFAFIALTLVAFAIVPSFAPAATQDTNAYASIHIEKGLTDLSPHYTGPNAGWTCASSDSGGSLDVSCTPNDLAPAGQWVCPNPYVLSTQFGSGLDSVRGTVGCGAVKASCSPSAVTEPASLCEEHIGGPAPMPFTCRAEYVTPENNVPSMSAWTVHCQTHHS